MYQKIDFSKLGGFPLTQNTMDYLQSSYNDVLEALSRALGDYVIISGLTNLGGNLYSNGWVTFNGEIIPFEGGLGQTNVSIIQSGTSLIFGDGNTNIVQFGRKAVFDAFGSTPFSNFKKITLESLNTFISGVEVTANSALANSNNALIVANNALTVANNALTIANNALIASASGVPSGTIAIWRGSIATIPSGWILCNGANGTPNLVGRFVYGADDSSHISNQAGGQETVTLTVAQLPAHQHNIIGSGGNSFGGLGQCAAINPSFNEFAGSTEPQGGGQPHNNMPPYRKLAFIMKQ